MGKRKNLNDSEKGQLVMARQQGQVIASVCSGNYLSMKAQLVHEGTTGVSVQ